MGKTRIVAIEFMCSGFEPETEEYIRYVLVNWMKERGLFTDEEGRPKVEIIEKR